MAEELEQSSRNDVTTYFTGLASAYADHRPSYPPEAIEWIVADVPSPVRAADIGCGTGISTRLLARAGARVIGVDPNEDMLNEARGRTPSELDVDYRIGAGERTGLENAGVDLVLCAQSFHWFDAAAALREFHRILRKGGRLALMWNVKVPADPFSAQFIDLAERAQADAGTRGLIVPDERQADPTDGGFFDRPRQHSFSNPQPMDWDRVLGRAHSASYWPKQGSMRSELESELRRVFEQHQHDGRVVLMHHTDVTLADRFNS